MLKKIKTWQLKVGMYVVDINHAWPSHSFAKNSFIIESTSDIQKFTSVGLTAVEIDTSKGINDSTDLIGSPEICQLDDFDADKKYDPSDDLEYQNAKQLFTQAKNLYLDLINDVKKGDLIEIKKIEFLILKLLASLKKNINALLTLSRIRDTNSYMVEHPVSVAILLMVFAKRLEMSDQLITELGIGGFLLDIGKIKTPIDILEKKGKLTDSELVVMRRHVIDGFAIVNESKGASRAVLDLIMQHHERMDGSGYPNGLKGKEITTHGQMAAIVDVYDAIASTRCYGITKEPTLVLRLLHKWSDLNFDSNLVQQFIKSIGIYPPGSLLLLSNNYLAKVISVGDKLLQPKVKMFMDVTNNAYIDPIVIDLAEQEKITIKSVESFKKWDLTW